MTATDDPERKGNRLADYWRIRLAVLSLFFIAIGVIWVTNHFLSERYQAANRATAEVRMALFSGNLISEMRRHAIVPLLLSRDPSLISALSSGDFTQSSQRLIDYRDEIGAARLKLLDADGRVVASTDRSELGASQRQEPYVVDALRSNDTVFTIYQDEVGLPYFLYSRKVEREGGTLGVIVVDVDLRKYEENWANISEEIVVSDAEGNILLSTVPRWRGMTVSSALETETATNALERALKARTQWTNTDSDAYVGGEAMQRTESRMPFQGWRITQFSTFDSVRERVNTVLAVEVMVFAILMASLFYWMSRQAQRQTLKFHEESMELRRLNVMLQREITEREKAERNLEVAEQTLAQSSKLAALGEMSAAVSHELNQPLAAMKTYLAGSRLLIARKRIDEALSSFQRINDLIDRMGAITRQLKSYARKGSDIVDPVDVRDAVRGSMEMMEPQLRRYNVKINLSLPEIPVMVMGERVRLEQVIINLLRNAVDATRECTQPEIDVILSVGRSAILAVRDNGDGITDLEALFEPFYTTKPPGDGVGLGLAISSSIINGMDGRLTGRNRANGGAVFEMQLPLAQQDNVAAE